MSMQIEAYDLDTLRRLIRELQAENRELRELLTEKNISCDPSSVFTPNSAPDEYDPDQGSRIIPFSVDDGTAKRFYARFWGRTDVFAKRGKNGGCFPQCENRWTAALCPKQRGEKHPLRRLPGQKVETA